MGCPQSLRAKQESNMIDKYPQKDGYRTKHEWALLLLGARESGKNTFMRQIKIIHEGEPRQYRTAIYRDIIQAIADIIRNMKRLNIEFGDMARADDVRQLFMFEEGVMSEEIASVIRRLGDDVGVQACVSRSDIGNTASYYLNNLNRISQTNYVPSQQDLLQVRVKPTGIEEASFTFKNQNYKVINVRQQLKNWIKWIPCFQDVTNAVIFCVALSDYDQLLEDGTNRMHESMNQFEFICNSRWFVDSMIFLLFTKKDLFEEKISRIPLTTCFPEYSGANTYEDSMDYIKCQFDALNQMCDTKDVFMLFTRATDTENVEFVMDVATDIIIRSTQPRQPIFLI
ncbi:guanine nucleotide-binding protein G(i) subunit alpha-3-like [Discoglossus pictus]